MNIVTNPNDFLDFILTNNNEHEKLVMARVVLSTFLNYDIYTVSLTEINSLSHDALIKTLSFIYTNRVFHDYYYKHCNTAYKRLSDLESLVQDSKTED